ASALGGLDLDDDEEDEASEFGSLTSGDLEAGISDPFGEEDEDSDFVAEAIPDPFGTTTSDDLDLDLGDLDEEALDDFSVSDDDDLDDLGLDDLGEATTGDPDEDDLDALGLGDLDSDDEDEEISGFLSDFK
ncbi:MAG: hypothetical protein ACEQSB_07405, partial [Undibacterium sp.]